MLRLSPSWRLAQLKFRKVGVLLPFGTSAEKFTVPNPTLFNDYAWSMPESSDPLDGWSSTEFMTGTYSAKHDIYGQLHFHLKSTLFKFCQKIAMLNLNIHLFQMDVEDLPGRIFRPYRMEVYDYDRIEVSNIADRAYLGPKKTLARFSPIIKDRDQNSHATLLTLFLNATTEMTTIFDAMACYIDTMRAAKQFVPVNLEVMSSMNPADADFVKLMQAQSLFRQRYPI